MSLINEALKKAQRQRMDESAQVTPPMPGGSGPIAKRSQPRSLHNILIFAGGAAALVVVSVIITAFLLNRNEPAPTPIVSKATPSAAATAPASVSMPPEPATKKAEDPAPAKAVESMATSQPPSPAAPASPPQRENAPPVRPSAGSNLATKEAQAAPAVSPAPVSAPPAAATTHVPVASAGRTEPPLAAAPAVSAALAPPASNAPLRADERVYAFLDTVRVGAFRAAGSDSRVLMNDKFYRVNDIVERNLNIRLIKVASDSLTFTDANGIVYVKHF